MSALLLPYWARWGLARRRWPQQEYHLRFMDSAIFEARKKEIMDGLYVPVEAYRV